LSGFVSLAARRQILTIADVVVTCRRVSSGDMRRTAVLLLLIGAIGALAITSAEKPVTFSETIAPIVFARCAGCHRDDGAAPEVSPKNST
jgi:hypothetical protein